MEIAEQGQQHADPVATVKTARRVNAAAKRTDIDDARLDTRSIGMAEQCAMVAAVARCASAMAGPAGSARIADIKHGRYLGEPFGGSRSNSLGYLTPSIAESLRSFPNRN